MHTSRKTRKTNKKQWQEGDSYTASVVDKVRVAKVTIILNPKELVKVKVNSCEDTGDGDTR